MFWLQLMLRAQLRNFPEHLGFLRVTQATLMDRVTQIACGRVPLDSHTVSPASLDLSSPQAPGLNLPWECQGWQEAALPAVERQKEAMGPSAAPCVARLCKPAWPAASLGRDL